MTDIDPIVFVVDDDISVREALQGLLRRAGWQVQTYESAEDFLASPVVAIPSCLIVDVTLPNLNGLDLQTRLAIDRRELPVIVITGHGDIPMSVRAMKAGALEFLTKPFGAQDLLDAVSNALDRSRHALEAQAGLQALQARFQRLTRRERQIMAAVVTGRLNKLVGADLGISEITVKAHRGKLMKKMQAGSLAELVRMSARLGLPCGPKT